MNDRRRVVASVVFPLWLFAAAAPASDSASAGLYAAECGFCHGERGGGDGPGSAMLKPPPTAFADAAYWQSADRAALAQVIAKGKAGTGMMAFGGKLSEAQIAAMIDYLESFAR